MSHINCRIFRLSSDYYFSKYSHFYTHTHTHTTPPPPPPPHTSIFHTRGSAFWVYLCVSYDSRNKHRNFP